MSSFAEPTDRDGPPPGSRAWWIERLRAGFGRSFWIFAAFALAAGLVCYVALGPDAFVAALDEDAARLGTMLPRVAAAQVVAGLVWVLLPRELYARLLGGRDQRRGLIVATAAGIVTPGGPASAFALLALMAHAGVDRGVLVTYITSWSLLGLQRIVVWDLPLMGPEFSALRFAICLPLPIAAGLIARYLPLRLALPADAKPPPERPT